MLVPLHLVSAQLSKVTLLITDNLVLLDSSAIL